MTKSKKPSKDSRPAKGGKRAQKGKGQLNDKDVDRAAGGFDGGGGVGIEGGGGVGGVFHKVY
jgi:hypothetical protein